MSYLKIVKLNLALCLILILITILTLHLLTSQSNYLLSETYHIPNIVHYVLFETHTISFINYLSIVSVLKVQKPECIFIHSDINNITGYYYDKIKEIDTNSTVVIKYLAEPTHVYGQPLSSVYHKSDIARIEVLREHGGIYLDFDVLVLNNLSPFRNYDMVLGWPKGGYIGTQVLMASASTQFLDFWLQGYRKYHPRDWYYNAGVVPTQILQRFPGIAHHESWAFGVENLLAKLHGQEMWNWRALYTIHLLSRHEPTPKNLSEEVVLKLESNFGRIAQWILRL